MARGDGLPEHGDGVRSPWACEALRALMPGRSASSLTALCIQTVGTRGASTAHLTPCSRRVRPVLLG